ncbi:MAG: hypothetical protein ABIF77_08825 [bacterium]
MHGTRVQLSFMICMTALVAISGTARGQVEAGSTRSSRENVTITDCHAIVYGWGVTGTQGLALEDTVVYFGEWQVFPELLPQVDTPAPSASETLRHALHVSALSIQQALLNAGKSAEESKRTAIEHYRESPLVQDIVPVNGNRYHLWWAGEETHTVLYIEDEPPAPPSPESVLAATRDGARKRFEMLRDRLLDGYLVIISSYYPVFIGPANKDAALADIAELLYQRPAELTVEGWGHEQAIPLRVAEQLLQPLSESQKLKR